MTEIVPFETSLGIHKTYNVHFIIGDYKHSLEFEVYPVQHWTGPDNTSGVDYLEKDKPDGREFEKDKCLMSFNGSYTWRGVWDGRLYFPGENEYWDEELAEMSELYNNFIVPWCKEWIKKSQPELSYD